MKYNNNLLFYLFTSFIFIKLFLIHFRRRYNIEKFSSITSYTKQYSNINDNLINLNNTLKSISSKMDFLNGYKTIKGGSQELDLTKNENRNSNYHNEETKYVEEEDDDEKNETKKPEKKPVKNVVKDNEKLSFEISGKNFSNKIKNDSKKNYGV